jgi:hypothetical protein
MCAYKPPRSVARNLVKKSLVRVSFTTLNDPYIRSRAITCLHLAFTVLSLENVASWFNDTNQSEQVDKICAHRIDEAGVSDPVLPPTLPTFDVWRSISDIQATDNIPLSRPNNI